jgi:hypothetical protein
MSFAWTAIGVAIVGAATSISLGMASASNQRKAARKQLEATAMQTKVKADERIKQIRRLASQQKSSFLASGISLTGDGTPDAIISETYDVGMADVENIKKFGSVQGENISATARAQMLSTYGQMASDVSSYASMGMNGAGSLKATGSVAELGGGLEGMGDSYGGLEGMGSGSAFGGAGADFGGGSTSPFNNFQPSAGFGGI